MTWVGKAEITDHSTALGEIQRRIQRVQEFDVNIRAPDVTPLSEPPAPQPLRCALLAGARASVGAAGLLEANGPLGAASPVREQKEVGALGRGGGWAACIGGEGSPFAPPVEAQAAPRKGRGRRRVRRGGGAGAEVTVPAPGRSPGCGVGVAGSRMGRRERGPRGRQGRGTGAGAGRTRRGGGGGARDPLARRPPCTPSRAAAAARPQPTWAETSWGPALHRRARSPATTDGGARARRPGPRASLCAARAPHATSPRAERGVPGAEQGALPAAGASADSEGRGRPGGATRSRGGWPSTWGPADASAGPPERSAPGRG